MATRRCGRTIASRATAAPSSIRGWTGPRPSSSCARGSGGRIDSYSAFFENDRKTPTGLAGYLGERGIGAITLVGLATDYCVAFSALDAVRRGLKTTVRLDCCRAIDLGGSLEQMLGKMREAGVRLV